MRFIIDGHNLIGRMPDISLHDPHDEEALVRRLGRWLARKRHAVTVVFDPGEFEVTAGFPRRKGIRVLFAPQGHTADGVILREVKRSSSRREITVVTSDRGLAGSVRAWGAHVMTAEEFMRLMGPAPLRDKDDSIDEKPSELNQTRESIEEWLTAFGSARRHKRPDD